VRSVRLPRPLALLVALPLVLAVGLALLPYAGARFYRFDATTPFTGAQWHNPYAGLDTAAGRWRQANFHAHSRAWGGLTHGGGTPDAVLAHYRTMGYDIAALSNYFAPLPAPPGDSTFVPAYEHGLNVRKTHRLVLGARTVDWFDFPLGQSVHQKQQVLSRLRESGALVALTHPALRDGHTAADVRTLADYDLIEVLNHFVTSDAVWDAALTAGRLAWLIANDDGHDAAKPWEMGVAWTMLFTASTHAESTYAALRTGRSYGVRGSGGHADLALTEVAMVADTLGVRYRGGAATVRVIGDGGRLIASIASTGTAQVPLPAWTHYARVVIEGPTTALWLNPVVRWDGQTLPVTVARVDLRRTWAYRGLLAIACAAIVARWRPARRRLPVRESGPVAA
jgi:hypothetical protein